MSLDAASIVREVEERGIRLSVVDGKIRYSPKSQTPEELLDALKARKDQVLAYLSGRRVIPSSNETASLLAWASELADRELVLCRPLKYIEAPLRKIRTERVSWYARHYLKTIGFARINQETSGWGNWTPDWWKGRENDALEALRALRRALDTLDKEAGR